MELTNKIEALLEEKFQSDEVFADCYVIEVELNQKRLNIFLDSDSGISLAKCQKISRFIEGHLDEEGWLGEKYWLEISSPGLSRPLKVVRQYQKNIDKTVELRQEDGTILEGLLVAADADTYSVEFRRIEREGKKKKEVVEVIQYAYESYPKVLVKPSFKKLKMMKKLKKLQKKEERRKK